MPEQYTGPGTATNPLKAPGTIQEIATRVKSGQWTTLDLDALANFVLAGRWTTELPTVEGYYWVRSKDVKNAEPSIAWFRLWRTSPFVEFSGNDEGDKAEYYEFWSERIMEPGK